MKSVKVLCIGDIVGSPGRDVIIELVPKLRESRKIDFVVANAENASGGNGLMIEHAKNLLSAGVDVITMGDHVWDKRELIEYLKVTPTILRPFNFPANNPGNGYTILNVNGIRFGVIHLIGRVFMRVFVDCPFASVDNLLQKISDQADIIVVDMHAEATSEKVAMGWHLNGRAHVIFGTHTHIQTADETILPKGTAYITDAGMTGPYKSVIGRDIDKILSRFMTQMPAFMDIASEDVRLCGLLTEIDIESKRAVKVERVVERL
ncbi:MAG: TIGR00282 family metallophosphoesterase [Planctomycetes bacterium]|nr:TIGR00282 family metallophosphoesterase [Planctomycetota bacterium]